MILSFKERAAGPWALLLPVTSRRPPARGEAVLPSPGGWDPRPRPGHGSPTTYVQPWGGSAGRRTARPRRRAASDQAVGETGDPIKRAGPPEAPPCPCSGHTPHNLGPAAACSPRSAELGVRASPAEGVSAPPGRTGLGAGEEGGGAGRPGAARSGQVRRGAGDGLRARPPPASGSRSARGPGSGPQPAPRARPRPPVPPPRRPSRARPPTPRLAPLHVAPDPRETEEEGATARWRVRGPLFSGRRRRFPAPSAAPSRGRAGTGAGRRRGVRGRATGVARRVLGGADRAFLLSSRRRPVVAPGGPAGGRGRM